MPMRQSPNRYRCICGMLQPVLMKNLDYGKGYRYAHDQPDAVTDMECLPPGLSGRRYYQPTDRGLEKELGQRIDEWRAKRTNGSS